MSVYLFTGKDMYRQEERLAGLLKEMKINPEMVIRFDASDAKSFHIDSAILECDTFSLFDDAAQKAVILKDPFFLNPGYKEDKSDKAAKEKDYRLSILDAYLKQPNPNTFLIFFCPGFDADTRRKEYKLITGYDGITILKFDRMKPWEFEKYADKKLKEAGKQLESSARRELLARVDNDTLLLHNALVKLDLYGGSRFSYEDIRNLVPLQPDVNIFKMSKMYLEGNLKGVLDAKNDMVRAGYDNIAMAAMLASRLRTMYTMKKLYERGYSEAMIATRLHQKDYAVKKGLESCFGLSSRQILDDLCELAALDQGIKAGTIDPKQGFDSFLLRNGNHYAEKQRMH
ncbi:MAG: DNA polymerase III subunit delta [Solobacterium sp.]|nr:DNA polymerase III subunit delta [Solobacterium sp.]